MAIGYRSGINIDGNSTVTGTFSVSSVTQDNSSYTGIMVWDGGVLKYRTKAQILSDIGAGSGSGTVSSVSLGTLTGLSGSVSNATSTPSITLTNTDPGSSQNIFKTIAVSGQTSITAASNSQTLTVVGAGGMTVTTNNSSKTLTLTSANDNDNHYLTSVSFNTSTGVLTFNRNGLSSTTVDIDGRYVPLTGGSGSGNAMTGDLHIISGGPKIYLQDNTDDDDQAIIFRNNGGSDEYKIATADFTSGGGADGFYIGSTTSDGEIGLVTANTTALTLDTSQNALFAGKVQLTSSSDYIDVISSDLYIVAAQKNIIYSGGAETIRLETTGQVEFDKYGSQTFTGTSASYLIATSSGDIIEKTPAQVRSDIGAVSSSGVTSIATNTGITGGTITSTGTLKIDYTGSDSVIQSAPNINTINKEDTFIINTAEDGNVYETSISNLSSTFGIHTGTGTANTLAKWTGTSALGNSEITDTGALVKIGSNSSGQETLYIDTQNRKVGFRTQTPGSAFDVNGTFRARNELNIGATNEQNFFVEGGSGARYVKMGAYTKNGNFAGLSTSANLLRSTAGFGTNGKVVQASRFWTTKIEQGGWPTSAGMANGLALTPTPGSSQVMYIRNIFVNKTGTLQGENWSNGTYPIEFGWLSSNANSASRFIGGIPRNLIISGNPTEWFYQVTINAESNNPYGTPYGPVSNKPLILNTPSVIRSTNQPTYYIQVEYTLLNVSNFRTNVDQTYT